MEQSYDFLRLEEMVIISLPAFILKVLPLFPLNLFLNFVSLNFIFYLNSN